MSLVTGAAGFIGANLVRALVEAGAEVHAFVHSRTYLRRLEGVLASLTLHRGDLTVLESVTSVVRSARPDVVFHLAAPARPSRRSRGPGSPARLRRPRDRESASRLRAADVARLVHVGSGLEYGPGERPLAEEDPSDPLTFRGAAKAAATLLCRQEARSTGQSIVILRPFSVYGPWETPARFIPTVIRAGLEGAELPLTARGIRRDYVFVGDVVDACLLAAEADLRPGEVLNVGSGSASTDLEVVAAVEKDLGRRIEVCRGAFPARELDSQVWVADTRRARERLGWDPRHSLSAGLAKTIAWQRTAGRASP